VSPPRTETSLDKRAIEAIAEPVCRAHGLELVDVQWTMDRGGPVLRVLIDRDRPGAGGEVPGSGVSLGDCQEVSRDLSTALDVHERVVPGGRYRLEVSSPGLDRPLVKPRDFERFAGREVKVQTRMPVAGTADRRKVQGLLRGMEGDVVVIDDGPTSWRVPFADIVKAHVVFRFTRGAS
jgi:ribosome maturation factor RimP